MHYISHASRLVIGLLVCMALCGANNNTYASAAADAHSNAARPGGPKLTLDTVLPQAASNLRASYNVVFSEGADKALQQRNICYAWTVSGMKSPEHAAFAREQCRDMASLLGAESLAEKATDDEAGNQLAASMRVAADYFTRYSSGALARLLDNPANVRKRLYRLFGLPQNVGEEQLNSDLFQRLVRAFAGAVSVYRMARDNDGASTNTLFAERAQAKVRLIFADLDREVADSIIPYLVGKEAVTRKHLFFMKALPDAASFRVLQNSYAQHGDLAPMPVVEEEIDDEVFALKFRISIVNAPAEPKQVKATIRRLFKETVLTDASSTTATDFLSKRVKTIAAFQAAIGKEGFTLGVNGAEAGSILMILRNAGLITFQSRDFDGLVDALRKDFLHVSGEPTPNYFVELDPPSTVIDIAQSGGSTAGALAGATSSGTLRTGAPTAAAAVKAAPPPTAVATRGDSPRGGAGGEPPHEGTSLLHGSSAARSGGTAAGSVNGSGQPSDGGSCSPCCNSCVIA